MQNKNTKKYRINKTDLLLKIQKNVFLPSELGINFCESVTIKKGEKVLDLGSGTGFLSIYAAKNGAIVYATDIVDEAVTLTQKNAEINNVSINIKKGDLFKPFSNQTFDVILANVPQHIIPKKMSKDPGLYGGDKGTDVVIKTLRESPKYMSVHSRLYIALYSMVDYQAVANEMLKKYNCRLVSYLRSEVKDFVYENINFYLKRKEISMYKIGNKYFSDWFIFELIKK